MDLRLPARLGLAPLFKLLPRRLYAEPHTVIQGGLTEWAAELPREDAAALIGQFVAHLDAIRDSKLPLRRQLKETEHLYQHLDPLLRDIERLLDKAALPIDRRAATAAGTADKLLRQFTGSYLSLAQQLEAQWFKPLYRRAHILATLRAAQLCYRRAMIAHRAGEEGSTRRWRQMMQLLVMARSGRFLDEALLQASQDTVSRIAVQFALISLMEPASLGAELGRLRFYVERHAQFARLGAEREDAEKSVALFVLGASGPRRLKTGQTLGENELLLDLRPLIDRLVTQLKGLRQGDAPGPLGLPLEARDPAYAFMLTRCREQWTRPRTRKVEKDKPAPPAELVFGFDSSRHFIATAAFRRSRAHPLDGMGEGLAVCSHWTITESSSAGYVVRYDDGNATLLTVGELVALHPGGSEEVVLCAVRRGHAISSETPELGLENLSTQAMPASMDKPSKGASAPVPVILLPKVAKLGGRPGLLAPIGDVTRGMSITVPHKGREVRLEAEGVVERLASCELIALRKLREEETAS